MPDAENENNNTALIRPPTYAIHKPSHGLVGRGLHYLDRLVNIKPVNVVIFYQEEGVPLTLGMLFKQKRFKFRINFNWLKEIEDFWAWVYSRNCDLILMYQWRFEVGKKGDSGWRGISNFDWVWKIRKDFPKCRIIIVCSALTPSEVKEWILRGANDFLYIPFNVEDFFNLFETEIRIIDEVRIKKEVRILMSVNDPGLTETLTVCLRAAIGQKHSLQIAEIPYAINLLEHAQSEPVDIFILILNNMLFADATPYPPDKRIKEALNIVFQIKEKYRKPIIAMAGWPDDPGFEEEAKLAGATFFFRLPFEVEEFQGAVETCITNF